MYPPGRPTQIVADGYNWGKPLGFVNVGEEAAEMASVREGDGVFFESSTGDVVKKMRDGLAVFKFVDRFALDEDADEE